MVRRVAAQHLGTLLTNLIQDLGAEAISQGGVVESTVIPLYEELASNDQDSVRLQTAENCVAFGKAIGTSEKTCEDYEILHFLHLIDLALHWLITPI